LVSRISPQDTRDGSGDGRRVRPRRDLSALPMARRTDPCLNSSRDGRSVRGLRSSAPCSWCSARRSRAAPVTPPPASAPPTATRRAPRRTQCVNNLKQLRLAAMNYESSNAVLPSVSLGATNAQGLCSSIGFGPFVRLLNYLEQSPIHNAVNFSLSSSDPSNVT